MSTGATLRRPPSLAFAAVAVSAAIAVSALMVLGVIRVRLGDSTPAAVPDIPETYLVLYRQAAERFALGPDGWSYLAAVGKIECDHGRSKARGCHRGEANLAGARGPAQFLSGTWSVYGVDADGDRKRDVYDPADAVFGMANYLHASGAPGDWRRALFAYNHAGWYAERVLGQAAEYRRAETGAPVSSGTIVAGSGDWLAPLPGFPGERCDARIVPDVLALVRAFGLFVSDCFGAGPHARNGEHPLGLAIDASPADGDWRRTELVARRFGWRESCALAGCPGAGVFRVILYNGYPGHGDPRHSSVPHIHLSWQHGAAAPFTRAPWVRAMLSAALPSSKRRR